MKNAVKSSYRNLFAGTFLSLFLTVSQGFTTAQPETFDPCPTPNAWIADKDGSSIQFDLDIDGGVDQYKIRFIRDGVHASPVYTISGSSHTFQSLQSGTYRFIITAECGYNSTFIIIDDIVI